MWSDFKQNGPRDFQYPHIDRLRFNKYHPNKKIIYDVEKLLINIFSSMNRRQTDLIILATFIKSKFKQSEIGLLTTTTGVK